MRATLIRGPTRWVLRHSPLGNKTLISNYVTANHHHCFEYFFIFFHCMPLSPLLLASSTPPNTRYILSLSLLWQPITIHPLYFVLKEGSCLNISYCSLGIIFYKKSICWQNCKELKMNVRIKIQCYEKGEIRKVPAKNGNTLLSHHFRYIFSFF